MEQKKTEQHFKAVLTRMLDERYEPKAEQVRISASSERHPDMIDWATQERDRDLNLRILERDSSRVVDIIRALTRIEQGTYGICELCEEEIGLERLEASPVATLCIACKKREESRPRSRQDFQQAGFAE